MSPIILTHIISGIATAFFGYYTLRKIPTPTRVFILLTGLFTVATTGLFIKTFGSFSFLHLFSVITLASVFLYLRSKGALDQRIKNIVGPYIGLIIAFAFTLLPTRRLGTILTDTTGSQIYTYVVFVVLLIVSITISLDLIRRYFIKK